MKEHKITRQDIRRLQLLSRLHVRRLFRVTNKSFFLLRMRSRDLEKTSTATTDVCNITTCVTTYIFFFSFSPPPKRKPPSNWSTIPKSPRILVVIHPLPFPPPIDYYAVAEMERSHSVKKYTALLLYECYLLGQVLTMLSCHFDVSVQSKFNNFPTTSSLRSRYTYTCKTIDGIVHIIYTRPQWRPFSFLLFLEKTRARTQQQTDGKDSHIPIYY